MAEGSRLLQVGVVDPGGANTAVNADVKSLGSDVPVKVALSSNYQLLEPPGWPARPFNVGAATREYGRTISSGSTVALLAAEANAVVGAGGGSFA